MQVKKESDDFTLTITLSKAECQSIMEGFRRVAHMVGGPNPAVPYEFLEMWNAIGDAVND